jgi:MIP family channel proteins
MPIAYGFGISIMFMVHSIGHLTGGHMNPAVSLMMVFKRKMSWTKMAHYWIAQFTGALMAASIVWGCVSGYGSANLENSDYDERPPLNLGATTLDPNLTTANGFLCEFMGSLVFYFVICQTALDKRGIAESMFPAIPIGFSLVVVHVCLVPFTGCGVNPARTFGPSMVTCIAGECDQVVQSSYWIYWIGPFAASLVAAELSEWIAIEITDNDGITEEKQVEESAPEGYPDNFQQEPFVDDA